VREEEIVLQGERSSINNELVLSSIDHEHIVRAEGNKRCAPVYVDG
jgi:hypothetical protein